MYSSVLLQQYHWIYFLHTYLDQIRWCIPEDIGPLQSFWEWGQSATYLVASETRVAPTIGVVCTFSRIALYWIRGFDKEWKQFDQNRVNETRSLVPIGSWYHCPGEQNPADQPSAQEELMYRNSLTAHCGVTLNSNHSVDLHSVPNECLTEMWVKDRPAFSSLPTQNTPSRWSHSWLWALQHSGMTSEGDVTCVMNFISVLKTKVKSVFLIPAGAEMYYMQYKPPHWVCTSAFGMYLRIEYVPPHWVCTSALSMYLRYIPPH